MLQKLSSQRLLESDHNGPAHPVRLPMTSFLPLALGNQALLQKLQVLPPLPKLSTISPVTTAAGATLHA